MLGAWATIASTGMLVSLVAPTQIAVVGGTSGPRRDSYSSPGHSIAIVGRPQVADTNEVVVEVRYSCIEANDVQIGVKVFSQANVYSNRFARFGYPFQPAVCDDSVHLVAVTVAAHAASNTAPLLPGDIISVSAELVDYGSSLTAAPTGKTVALAGDLLEGVCLRDSKSGK